MALRAAELRAAGVAAINLDLMYGLPGQTLDDIACTLARTRLLAPSRVAMFGYAHMPRMLPRQRMIDDTLLPNAHARFTQSLLAHEMLEEQGFATIGFDHYARPDDPLAEAAAALVASGRRAATVMNQAGRLLGVINESGVLTRVTRLLFPE